MIPLHGVELHIWLTVWAQALYDPWGPPHVMRLRHIFVAATN